MTRVRGDKGVFVWECLAGILFLFYTIVRYEVAGVSSGWWLRGAAVRTVEMPVVLDCGFLETQREGFTAENFGLILCGF